MSESKNLSELLVVKDELPSDFFSNAVYDQQLDAAIEATNNLVYPLDAEGEKLAKTDATSINKFATMFNGFIAKTFKKESTEITLWRDGKKQKTKTLLENRQKLIDQFVERRQEVLDKVSTDLDAYLKKQREHNEIGANFYGEVDFSSLIKLTGTLTPKGALTKKATDFILGIVTSEKAEQVRIETRHLHLENRCLRAEINPPLTHIHLGTDFYADDAVFDAKVEGLIDAEIVRKKEMEARIIEQQESKKQAEIDAALKAQQQEADASARANVQNEKLTEDNHIPPVPQPNTQAASVEKASVTEPVNPPVNGKHEVILTAVFRMQVSDRVSNKAVADHFIKQLPEKLGSAVTSVVAV